jgi:hypothetical protein
MNSILAVPVVQVNAENTKHHELIHEKNQNPLSKYAVNPLHYQFFQTDSNLSNKIDVSVEHPVIHFNVKGIGVGLSKLKNEIADTYKDLPWDMYLVKKDQIDFIICKFPEDKNLLLTEILPDYFSDVVDRSVLNNYIDRLSINDLALFNQIKPYRRRGISQFMLTKSEQNNFEWTIEELPYASYSQKSDVKFDYRKLPRKFAPSSAIVTSSDEFRKILVHLAVMSDISRFGKAKKIKIICQQVGIVTDPNQQVSNAPEGIHQDGCDYIVSALVIERKGVAKGASVVFGSDKKTEYLRCILKDGDAIFQADTGSPLWHVVEPIEEEKKGQQGVRNIIGYDIYIEE